MIVIAALTPVLSNDRPFLFRGTMPGEYRKSFNQITRGATFQIIGLPDGSRRRPESSRTRRRRKRTS